MEFRALANQTGMPLRPETGSPAKASWLHWLVSAWQHRTSSRLARRDQAGHGRYDAHHLFLDENHP